MKAAILVRSKVLTMDPAAPYAEAVAVLDGRIAAVGKEAAVRAAVPADARTFDLAGRTLVPGFVDPHLHLLSYAAALRSVDCRPGVVRSIRDIQEAVRARARQTPPGEWVRAYGYRESELAERRHPTRWDLDAAAPGHPVRLIHGSGHAVVLNSMAMERAGIGMETPEPPGGYMERDVVTGEPTGLLVDMRAVVDPAVPPLAEEELLAGLREVSRRLLSAGITAVQDATETNGPDGPACAAGLRRCMVPAPRVTAMVGYAAFEEDPSAGGDAPVKVVVSLTGGRLHPTELDLRDRVWRVHAAGRRLAIHAVEREAVEAAASAIEAAVARSPVRPDHRHRVEHASVCPPDLARRLARLGVVVVSNPAFLDESGDRFLAEVDEADLPHLYAVGSLVRHGVRVAAASDAPVAEPWPLRAVAAAMTRRSRSGGRLPGETVGTVEEGLRLVTADAAFAASIEGEAGRIAPGCRADLVVLPGDPTTAAPEDLADWRPELVFLAGRPVDGGEP